MPTMMPLQMSVRKGRDSSLGLRLPEVFVSRSAAQRSPLPGPPNKLHASLSAPSSPASRSSIPRGTLAARCPTSISGISVRPPAPNICVQKGRIEFVKTGSSDSILPTGASSSSCAYSIPVPSAPSAVSGSPSAPSTPSSLASVRSTHVTYPVDKNRPAVMGSKIFRPQFPLRKNEPEEVSTSVPSGGVRHLPPVKWKPCGSGTSGESVSFRERSASPKFRDPTPPPRESSASSAGAAGAAEVSLAASRPRPSRKETLRPLMSQSADSAVASTPRGTSGGSADASRASHEVMHQFKK